MKQVSLQRTIRLAALLLIVVFSGFQAYSAGKKQDREFYQIKIYHFKNAAQEKSIDDYLKNALLPALHRRGISKTGVFKPLANDTAADKLIYVFMPLQSFEQLLALPAQLDKDAAYTSAASDYLNAVYNSPPYTRIESILLKAFRMAPKMEMHGLTGPQADRIFELRSYESATEKLYLNKVHMFNEGGEVPLFKRLAFNAIFYADVINGSHMPNLMYMTCFDSMAARDQHWKTFVADAEWKKLSARPEYQHNVSKAEIILMHSTEYSDI